MKFELIPKEEPAAPTPWASMGEMLSEKRQQMLNPGTENRRVFSLIAVHLLASWDSSHCKEANIREGSKTVADSSLSQVSEGFLILI